MALCKTQDDAIVDAIAAGLTPKEAAGRAGVSVRTVFRRLDTPAFARRVDAARAAIIGSATGKLCEGAVELVDVLLEVARNEKNPPMTRVAAAKSGLENLRSFRQELAVEQQIAELTRTVRELTSGQPAAT